MTSYLSSIVTMGLSGSIAKLLLAENTDDDKVCMYVGRGVGVCVRCAGCGKGVGGCWWSVEVLCNSVVGSAVVGYGNTGDDMRDARSDMEPNSVNLAHRMFLIDTDITIHCSISAYLTIILG